MKKFILLIATGAFISSCAKKYDWVCTCEIYTTTNSYVKTKNITNQSQSDANEQCAKFGEAEAGTGGSHDCSTNVK